MTDLTNYQTARDHGYKPQQALRLVRLLRRWNECSDLVRLRCEPEQESYFGTFGEPEGYVNQYGRKVSAAEEKEELLRYLERDGCWIVFSEFRADEDSEWEIADSIGMCIYADPLDWMENDYIPDLMESALKSLESLQFANVP